MPIPLPTKLSCDSGGEPLLLPEPLDELIGYVRDGDTVIVHSMDRLARNLDDLRRLVRTLTGKGMRVEFVKESLTFTGEDSPMASLLLSVMGAFAEFERALILERLRARVAGGESKAALAKEFGVSRVTAYSYLRAGLPPRHRPLVELYGRG
ncbi:recombinase family protein [Nocardia sp. NBC_01730]|uniref:recombinase family protein n=1 Tax=Nocardia sp. NBC_01730 TaxID=2975998 RepID=UPI003FA3C17D|nr:recombinase family protein [Nocardia sp. NBC_01730]